MWTPWSWAPSGAVTLTCRAVAGNGPGGETAWAGNSISVGVGIMLEANIPAMSATTRMLAAPASNFPSEKSYATDDKAASIAGVTRSIV